MSCAWVSASAMRWAGVCTMSRMSPRRDSGETDCEMNEWWLRSSSRPAACDRSLDSPRSRAVVRRVAPMRPVSAASSALSVRISTTSPTGSLPRSRSLICTDAMSMLTRNRGSKTIARTIALCS